MTDLGDSKSVIVKSGSGKVRLQLWACKGSLGVELDEEQAFSVASEIIAAVRRNRRGAR